MVWLVGIIVLLAVQDMRRSRSVAVAPEDEEPLWDDWSVSEARHVLRGLPDEE